MRSQKDLRDHTEQQDQSIYRMSSFVELKSAHKTEEESFLNRSVERKRVMEST